VREPTARALQLFTGWLYVFEWRTHYADRVTRAVVLVVLVVLVGAWSGAALAAPSSRHRVVLADPDPELRHAMEQALAPWHLEVVIEGRPPSDASLAQERADADTARFVVWREGRQLVVYDRELGSIERRDSRSGVLDPPTAAAAALTIKTMMRLPPPPAETAAPPPLAIAEPKAEAAIALRFQAAAAARIARGADTIVSTRLGGAAAIRPWPGAGWRFGVAGDVGTPTDVSRAGFKGTFTDWTALGFVGWTYATGAWEIEPHAGAGVRRATLDGVEMATARTEGTTLATARGGISVRWRRAWFSIGATVAADDSFGTPTYTKSGTPAQIFQVPGMGIELGAVIAVDR
jgi:hypothetical protein